MLTEKYKIWDNINKKWFTPSYPGFKTSANNKQITTTLTKEILFSQSGEMYMHECEQGQAAQITHLPILQSEENESPYIPCIYSGVKDINGRKMYLGDIGSNQVATWEVIFNQGCFSAKFISKIKPDGTVVKEEESGVDLPIHIALRGVKGLEYVGNKFESPELVK